MDGAYISVAMAVFNGENYLREQLESIFNQTRTPDEIIIVDDGSSDGTVEIVNEFVSRSAIDTRLYVNEKRLGYSGNFSRAIGLCKGDVIFLSDQDDVWLENKVESVLRFFDEKENVKIVIHDAHLVDRDLNFSGVTRLGQIKNTSFSHMLKVTTGCFTAFRKEILDLAFPVPSEHYGHDGWIHKIGYALDCRAILPIPLVLYRRHGNNVSKLPLNQAAKASPAEVNRVYLKGDSMSACFKRIESLLLLRERLILKRDSISIVFGEDVLRKGIDRVDREIASLKRRGEILKMKKISRPLWGVINYIRGDYKYSSGLKSLIKDIVISR